MAAGGSPVVACTYPTRDDAAELAAVLRESGISVAVVPSNQYAGEWDVMVPSRDAAGVKRLIDALLTAD